MKHVSARDFQQNAPKYLQDLPIVLTQYNKPIAVISPYAMPVAPKHVYNSRLISDEEIDKLTTGPGTYPVSVPESVIEEKSEWPKYYMGKPISGRSAECPVCFKDVPVEFSQQHYSKEHGDI